MTLLQRAFIALPVPLAAARQIQGPVASRLSRGSAVVAAENLHITLAFLGALPEASLQPLGEHLAPLVSELPLAIYVDGIGPFPHAQGKILAAAVVPTGQLVALFEGVKGALTALGLSADPHDAFRPHITLARTRTGHFEPLPTHGVPAAGAPAVFAADTLGIYQGALRSEGYRYQCLWSIARSAGSSSE